jgi:hypothetical protein
VLENYQDSKLFWIEDKPSNAELGIRYGLRPLLMSVSHNVNYNGPVPVVNNWAEIYKLVQSSL